MIPYLFRDSFPKSWRRELESRLQVAVNSLDNGTDNNEKMLFCSVRSNYFSDKFPEREFIPPFTYHFYSEHCRQMNDDAGGYDFEFGVYAWLDGRWVLIYHSDKWSDCAKKYFDLHTMELLKNTP